MPYRSEPVKNIVLVGRTGNGKSATGNSLIRKYIFKSDSQAAGVTMKCQTYRAATKSGPIINVIDTPGLFDLMASADFISKEIVRCLALAEEGLHAVVLVLSVRNRISKEEEETLCTLQVLFGSKILDYLIVVFTGGDDLECNNQTLDRYLSKCPEFLKKVFRLCGNRRVLFDNRTTDEDKQENQIQELLENVAAIDVCNRGVPFTDETHRMIKAETDRLREEQEAAKARYLRAAELEKMKKQLQKSYDSSLREMAEMMEITLREVWNSQQIMMYGRQAGRMYGMQAGASSNSKQVMMSSNSKQVMMSSNRGYVEISSSRGHVEISSSRGHVVIDLTSSCNIL